MLRDLLDQAIAEYVDKHRLLLLEVVEAEESDLLSRLADNTFAADYSADHGRDDST